MKVVVDTNILFSFFWKEAITRKLLVTSNLELISPKIALEELKKYSADIIKKTNLAKKDFNLELSKLQKIVNFASEDNFSEFIKEAEKISPDKADSYFFALCLKYSCLLWSNDSLLKAQNKIKVFSTEDLIDILF